MRVVVVYKEFSEQARAVEEFLRFFTSVTGRELETLEPETREGIGFCTTYDIMQYPTVIALSDDGQVQNKWEGLPLPTVDEVSFYA
ncbi:hypothetical protein KI440_03365 [Candidatus Saccharibacteria bacterium TM7i]|nr:hypothetical protein KI440_03365 [Candidatus Saccharibacteria bacterium TM7i]